MSDYRSWAKDLHTLAYFLTEAADELPAPMFDLPLCIDIHVAEPADVVAAAETLDVVVEDSGGGHTSASTLIDTVRLKFAHVTDDAMVKSAVRERFAATMPAGWPESVLTPVASVISLCEFCDQPAVAVVEGVWMCQGHVTAHDQAMSGDAS
jgi:hypothetical protein